MLVQKLLQRVDVLHRGAERLHFAHLLIGRAVGDVLAQRLESHIDLFDAVPLAFVASRHRDGLLLRDAVSQPAKREPPLAAQQLRRARALSLQHLRLGLRAILQDDGRVACTLRSIHVFLENLLEQQVQCHCQKTSDARLSCPSRGVVVLRICYKLWQLSAFSTRVGHPTPFEGRTLLARDPARRVTLREPGAWLRELNKQSDAFTAPARAVRSFTSQYPQPQSPLVDLN